MNNDISDMLQKYANENVVDYTQRSGIQQDGVRAIMDTANLLGCDIVVYSTCK